VGARVGRACVDGRMWVRECMERHEFAVGFKMGGIDAKKVLY
jgi:hypothetical protein